MTAYPGLQNVTPLQEWEGPRTCVDQKGRNAAAVLLASSVAQLTYVADCVSSKF